VGSQSCDRLIEKGDAIFGISFLFLGFVLFLDGLPQSRGILNEKLDVATFATDISFDRKALSPLLDATFRIDIDY
jgi:hypothetical protein